MQALKCILHTRSRGFLYARSLDKLVKFMKFQISIYEVAPSSSLFFSLCMRSFAQSLTCQLLSRFWDAIAYSCSWNCGPNRCWNPPICWHCCWRNWRTAWMIGLKMTCQPNFRPKLSWRMTWQSHWIGFPWPNRGYYYCCFLLDDGCHFSPSKSIHWPLKKR